MAEVLRDVRNAKNVLRLSEKIENVASAVSLSIRQPSGKLGRPLNYKHLTPSISVTPSNG